MSLHVTRPRLLVAVVTLACWTSGALGLAMGALVAPQRMGLVFSVLVVPLTFLGCVYYPWVALGSVRWVQIGVLANPVVYMSEGLRANLTTTVAHMATTSYLGAGTGFAVVLTVVGM